MHILNKRTRAIEQVRQALDMVPEHVTMRSLHQKQLDLARIHTLFASQQYRQDCEEVAAEDSKTTRIQHLLGYVRSHYKRVSCFEDLKPFMEQLDIEEVMDLLGGMGTESEDVSKPDTGNVTCLLLMETRSQTMS